MHMDLQSASLYIPLYLRVEVSNIKVNAFNFPPNIGILKRILKTITGEGGLRMKI